MHSEPSHQAPAGFVLIEGDGEDPLRRESVVGMVEGRARGFPGIAPAPAILAETPAHLIFARDGAGRIVDDIESATDQQSAVLLPLHDPQRQTANPLPTPTAIENIPQENRHA